MVKTIVASFDGYPSAQTAARKLMEDGYMSCDIGVVASNVQKYPLEGEPTAAAEPPAGSAIAGGLIGALIETGVPEDHAGYYAETVRRGGALVTVKVDASRSERAAEIMRAHGAIDLEERVSRWREAGWDGWNPAGLPYTPDEAERERRLYGTHADPLTGLPLTSDPEGDNRRDSTIRR